MMSEPNIFPDLSVQAVAAATEAHWDLTGPFPTPRGDWLRCPVCRCPVVQARTWTRITRVTHKITGRVDVSFKCTACAAAWTHGVAVPDEYAARTRRRLNEHIDWREVRAALDTSRNATNKEN